MLCSITGDKVTDPVVSPRSGAIFERKHILNFLSTSATDPINDEPLTPADLIPLATTVPTVVQPNAVASTSIPLLLATFQNEWDALALEVFTLRKQLHRARDELSAALYHQDAAVRVAAKAIRERDEAKAALQQLAVSIGDSSGNGNGNGHTSSSSVPVDEINAAGAELFKIHKSQKPSFAIKPDQAVSITLTSTVLKPFDDVSTSFYDAQLKQLLVALKSGTIARWLADGTVDELEHHDEPVGALNYIQYHGELSPAVAYPDKIVVGDAQIGASGVHQIIRHPGLPHLFLTLTTDSWSLYDIGQEPPRLSSTAVPDVTTANIHVDGILFAVGNKHGEIQVYNITDGASISTLKTKHPHVTKITFALNGYWLLVGSASDTGASIEVFDLRKNSVVHTVDLETLVDFTIDPSSSVVVSHDGHRLAVHRYVKKGKAWRNAVCTLDTAPVSSLHIYNDVHDDAYNNNNELTILAVASDSQVAQYQLVYT